MYGHIPTIAHLRDWCAANLRQGSPGRLLLHEAWRRHFAAKLAEQEREHSNSGLFGMSGAAGCLRAQAFRRAGVEGAPFSGDDLTTFEIGHALESFALAVLEASGFQLGGSQLPATIPGVMSSAADAKLLAGPVDLPYPLLLSVKTRAYKQGGKGKRRGFAALPLDGIFEAEPSAWTQSQLEMLALDRQASLVLVIAKDVVKVFEGDPYLPSLSWYAELVPRKDGAVDAVVSAHRKAGEVLEAGGSPLSVPPFTFWTEEGNLKPVRLPDPGNVKDKWGGVNQQATGRFNSCFGCQFSALCRGEA